LQLHYTHSLTLLFSRHCSDQPETHCWVMSDCECGNGAAPESAPESSNNIFDRRLQGGGCAGTGKVSEECGASGNGVKATCCEGLVCAGPVPSPTTECQPPSPTPPPTVAATPPPTDAPTSPLTAPVSWCHDDPPCYIYVHMFFIMLIVNFSYPWILIPTAHFASHDWSTVLSADCSSDLQSYFIAD